MAVFVINGLPVEVRAPLSIEEIRLTNARRAESGVVRVSRHGDATEALSFPVTTTILTTSEKDALEDELLASGPATISGDIFPTAVSAYVRPTSLKAGPLDDMWTWFFEVEEVGS